MSPVIDTVSGTLWFALVAGTLVVFVLGFAVVLARRQRHLLLAGLGRLDAWLRRHLPAAWSFTRRRFALDVWYGLALTVAVVLAAGSTLVFVEVTEGWTDQAALYEVDRAVHEQLDGTLTDGGAAFFRAVTHFGDFLVASALTLALALWFVRRRQRWRLLALGLTMVVGEAIVWTMKYVFARDRPGSQLADAVGASFPSGHSFTAMALYGFVIYLVWRSRLGRGAQVVATAVLAVVIVLVGLSRVMLNVHWVSDVLGGLTIGLGWLVTSLLLARIARAWWGARGGG